MTDHCGKSVRRKMLFLACMLAGFGAAACREKIEVLDGPGMVNEWYRFNLDRRWISVESRELVLSEDSITILEDGKEIGTWKCSYNAEHGDIIPEEGDMIGPYVHMNYEWREASEGDHSDRECIAAYRQDSEEPEIFWGE